MSTYTLHVNINATQTEALHGGIGCLRDGENEKSLDENGGEYSAH